MRRYTFKPYHQPIDEGVALKDKPLPENDTEWPEWEVFIQEKRGDNHINVGAVHAPDAEMALVLAKENFARRQSCVNIWIVNTEHVHATGYGDEKIFEFTFNRDYRNTTGYKLRKPADTKERE